MRPRDYGPFPYSPIHQRPKITWPNGASIAVWIITNLEFFPLSLPLAHHPGHTKGKAPSVRPWAQRDYGNRVGVWRLMDLMQKHNLPGTATVNSLVQQYHPEILSAARSMNWEFMGHNDTNSVWLTDVDSEEERQIIRRSVDILTEAGGKRPNGWLGSALAESWDTLDNLIDNGFRYVADWVNDDQPYVMDVDGRRIVSIPYSYEINDSNVITFRNGTIDEFATMIERQFDVLHEEGKSSGRVMAICLHPYLVGVPHRIKRLEEAFMHIKAHDDVWFATGSEIVDCYLSQTGQTL